MALESPKAEAPMKTDLQTAQIASRNSDLVMPMDSFWSMSL